MKDKMIILKIM